MAKSKRNDDEFLQSALGIERRKWVFFFGLLFVGSLTTFIYELVHDLPEVLIGVKNTGGLIRGGILVVLTLLLSLQANKTYRRHEQIAFEKLLTQFKPIRQTYENKLDQSYRGLIWLLSPKNPDTIEFPLVQHCKGLGNGAAKKKLEICWCIIPNEKPIKELAEEALQKIQRRARELKCEQVIIKPIWIDYAEVKPTFEAVNRIYDEEIPRINREWERNGRDLLTTSDVVSDITSGLRTMSAGMLLACMDKNRPVEYVRSEYDKHGNTIANTERLLKIDTNLILKKS